MMRSLVDQLVDCRRIAIAGICKNAGKTTVLNHLVDAFHKPYQLGITSIGYDGEERDGVTGLKKPRVMVHPDMIVVTTEACLEQTAIDYEIIKDTALSTALGRVVFIRAKSQGIIEISGPSMVSRMRMVSDEMARLGCDKILIDGAVGRMTHGAYTGADAMVLSVGGALSNDMEKVIAETGHLVDMLRLPTVEKSNLAEVMAEASPYRTMGYDISTERYSPYDQIKHDRVICVFRGAVTDKDVANIMATYKSQAKVIVVKNATSVFVSPRQYHKLRHERGDIRVMDDIHLVAITINPTSPYGKGFDPDAFQKRMREAIDLPVYNVMREGKT